MNRPQATPPTPQHSIGPRHSQRSDRAVPRRRAGVPIPSHPHRCADGAEHTTRHHQPGDRDRTVQQRRLEGRVETAPGAVMTIAGSDVLKQPADGTSIYAMSVPVTAAPAFFSNMPFQLEKDFGPVIKIATSYNVLVVNPAVAAKSVSELVSLIKAKPDKLTFSWGGNSERSAHLIGEMFKLQTGVRATHVPYQQFPQAIGDLINGTNQYMFITSLPVVELIESGKLRALAVTGPKQIRFSKDVPTIVEQGLPELVVEDWVGFAVKSGTPATSLSA